MTRLGRGAAARPCPSGSAPAPTPRPPRHRLPLPQQRRRARPCRCRAAPRHRPPRRQQGLPRTSCAARPRPRPLTQRRCQPQPPLPPSSCPAACGRADTRIGEGCERGWRQRLSLQESCPAVPGATSARQPASTHGQRARHDHASLLYQARASLPARGTRRMPHPAWAHSQGTPAEPGGRCCCGDVVWRQVCSPQPLPLSLCPGNHLLIWDVGLLTLILRSSCSRCCCRWRWWRGALLRGAASCRRRGLNRRRQRHVAAASGARAAGRLLLLWSDHPCGVYVVLEAVVLGRRSRLEAARQLEAAGCGGNRLVGRLAVGGTARILLQLPQLLHGVLTCRATQWERFDRR